MRLSNRTAGLSGRPCWSGAEPLKEPGRSSHQWIEKRWSSPQAHVIRGRGPIVVELHRYNLGIENATITPGEMASTGGGRASGDGQPSRTWRSCEFGI